MPIRFGDVFGLKPFPLKDKTLRHNCSETKVLDGIWLKMFTGFVPSESLKSPWSCWPVEYIIIIIYHKFIVCSPESTDEYMCHLWNVPLSILLRLGMHIRFLSFSFYLPGYMTNSYLSLNTSRWAKSRKNQQYFVLTFNRRIHWSGDKHTV